MQRHQATRLGTWVWAVARAEWAQWAETAENEAPEVLVEAVVVLLEGEGWATADITEVLRHNPPHRMEASHKEQRQPQKN